MDLSRIKIEPEFVNMVIRTISGEQSVHDTITGNPQAAIAQMLRLEKLRETNDHFIAQICKAHLFQGTVVACMHQLGAQTSIDTQRAVLTIFMAQGVLIGLHLHEQLLDKGAKGLVQT